MDSIIKAIMSKVGVTQEQAQQAFDVTVGELKAQLPKEAVKQIDKLLGIKSLSLIEQVTQRISHLKDTLTEAIEEASTKGESKVEELRNKYTELKTEAEQRLEELKSTAKSKVEAAKEKVEHAAEEFENQSDADNLNETELAAETSPVVNNDVEETPKSEANEKKATASTGLLNEAKERIEEVKERIGEAKEKMAVIQDLGKEKLEEVKEYLDESKDKWAKTLKENAKNWLDKIIPDGEEKATETTPAAEKKEEIVVEAVVVEETKEEAK